MKVGCLRLFSYGFVLDVLFLWICGVWGFKVLVFLNWYWFGGYVFVRWQCSEVSLVCSVVGIFLLNVLQNFLVRLVLVFYVFVLIENSLLRLVVGRLSLLRLRFFMCGRCLIGLLIVGMLLVMWWMIQFMMCELLLNLGYRKWLFVL